MFAYDETFSLPKRRILFICCPHGDSSLGLRGNSVAPARYFQLIRFFIYIGKGSERIILKCSVNGMKKKFECFGKAFCVFRKFRVNSWLVEHITFSTEYRGKPQSYMKPNKKNFFFNVAFLAS